MSVSKFTLGFRFFVLNFPNNAVKAVSNLGTVENGTLSILNLF